MQVMQQSLFDSQAHVVQVHKYCWPGIYSHRKMKVKPALSLARDELSGRYECWQSLEIHVN